MNPVFSSTLTDEVHGDQFREAVTRVSKFVVFAGVGTEYEAQQNDTYKEVEKEPAQEGEMPYKLHYSIEYWGNVAIKNNGKFKSRQFTKDGSGVFEIDFNDPEVQRVWENAPDVYQASLQQVMQWHFRTKVLGA